MSPYQRYRRYIKHAGFEKTDTLKMRKIKKERYQLLLSEQELTPTKLSRLQELTLIIRKDLAEKQKKEIKP